MKRLILEYQVGDGYNYESIITVPIIYESKGKALEDLQLNVLEYIDYLKVYSKKETELYEQLQHVKFPIKDKKNEKFVEAYKNFSEHQSSLIKTFNFGGQDLSYDNFIEAGNVIIPKVDTLEEFFAPVENKKLLKMK